MSRIPSKMSRIISTAFNTKITDFKSEIDDDWERYFIKNETISICWWKIISTKFSLFYQCPTFKEKLVSLPRENAITCINTKCKRKILFKKCSKA